MTLDELEPRSEKRLLVRYPLPADAAYAAANAGEMPYLDMRVAVPSDARFAGRTVAIVRGNGRERNIVRDRIENLRAPGGPDPNLATPRQRAYLADLADDDPVAASDFGIGPLAGGIPATLTRREASWYIDLLQ